MANKDADAVSEAELRTSDLAKILGEQENLTPGLSGGFALTLQPGTYKINCPGAAQPHCDADRHRARPAARPGSPTRSSPPRSRATPATSARTRPRLVTSTQQLCAAIDATEPEPGRARRTRKARVFYERIEPVAEIWGNLDTDIDGRWENPVTVQSQFIGFHRIEQMMWADNTPDRRVADCAPGWSRNEQQLLTLVRSASYNPLEMASGATDLINEAATAKIDGEEERYSNTDLPVFQANVDGAMEVVSLLKPYLQKKDASLLTLIQRRDAAIAAQMATLPGQPRLRRHRLRRVLDRPGHPAPPAVGRRSTRSPRPCPRSPCRSADERTSRRRTDAGRGGTRPRAVPAAAC